MTDTDTDAPDPTAAEPMPQVLRTRVVTIAAQALGAIPPADVPASLRAIARFVPSRRARSGSAALATALEDNAVFRQQVAGWLRTSHPALAAAVDQAVPPPAADPVDVAAFTYLLRPPGWQPRYEVAVAALAEVDRAVASAAAGQAVARLQEELDQARAVARSEQARGRSQDETLRSELADAKRRLREQDSELGRLRRAATTAERALAEAGEAQRRSDATAATEARRLRGRLAEAEAAVETSRRTGRESRAADDLRLRLLLDTVLDAAQGLRRELALPPIGHIRPADGVAAVLPTIAGVADVAVRALAVDDPAVLDQLLALPQVHLVVDGYNVTKTGYGALSLAEQRQRLLSGLAVLVARTGAEATCVFDGAEVGGVMLQASPRGVRVLFSPPGETADELIRRLVRAEPAGRPVVVVSSDKEVADGVARSGARPVPSLLLLRRLERA